ncbi:hypothetical protein QA612_19600 [Evansella sp. AB-P1]|uniref:hypothetical protein n=1 Tax=Evansella sp. AB-P1 TaxID=3037653 RepID=UPI00241CE20B|nr:hypothetical protein [Evansella sp. AB-P1]MDG5789666.1 hypothetical protein [Evansella sp. AB-P1]
MSKKRLTEMTAKITEVQDARDNVESFLEVIEETASDNRATVRGLEDELQKAQEALTVSVDIGESRMLKAQADAIEQDISLTQQVAQAKITKMYQELEDKVERFFNAHKGAVKMYQELDAYYVANTSLSALKEDAKLLSNFATELNNSFRAVRQVLLDTGLVSQAEQNKSYRGQHLGARDLVTELWTYESKVRGYVQQLQQAGKL